MFLDLGIIIFSNIKTYASDYQTYDKLSGKNI
jgi:hypothetical protein